MNTYNLVKVAGNIIYHVWDVYINQKQTIWFYFDDKVKGDTHSSLALVYELNMDQYVAPKQCTPAGGLHYKFSVDKSKLSKSEQRHALHMKVIAIILLSKLRTGYATANQVQVI